MRKVVLLLLLVFAAGFGAHAQEAETPKVDPMRQRCQQVVSALLGFEVRYETLDQEYLEPYWQAVSIETRQQAKSKERLFLVRIRHVVEQDVQQAVLAWRQKRLNSEPKQKNAKDK